MGNCCGNGSATHTTAPTPTTKPFQGQGHRLGQPQELTPLATTASGNAKKDEMPQPRRDETLTDEEREKQRRERVAAAEARLKKAGGLPKKKKEYKDVPLAGPNSKPTMTWNVG